MDRKTGRYRTTALLLFAITPACYHTPIAIPAAEERLGPEVVSFTAEPKVITAGQTARLRWTVRDSGQVWIEEAPEALIGTEAGRLRTIGAFNGSGTLEVHPRQTTEYVLNCEGSGGGACVSLSVKVKVAAAP